MNIIDKLEIIDDETILDDLDLNEEESESDIEDINKDNLIKKYLDDISSIKLLTTEEEIKYGRIIKENQKLENIESKILNEQGVKPTLEELSIKTNIPIEKIKEIKRNYHIAFNKLITSNLRLVVSIAKKFKDKGLPFSDLIQEGNLGLIRAVEKFDPDKGYRFSTYATWWIKQAISRGLATKSRTIRLPLHIVEANQKIKRMMKNMSDANMDNKNIEEEISKELNLSINKYHNIIQSSLEPISLDLKIKSDDDIYISDLVPSNSETPEEILIKEDMKEKVNNLLNTLTEKEKEVIKSRFGIGEEQKSIQSIAQDLGTTKERVRQIINIAIKKLKKLDKNRSYLNFIKN
ncbi:MAG: hypothetical protein KatS3mg068_0155 [Candidatus Sericytochromatia bacterium]|nr:MAG: hypothetical protein KatS3mg068_0155 [Candidatus Sericytochromatia bacterium]